MFRFVCLALCLSAVIAFEQPLDLKDMIRMAVGVRKAYGYFNAMDQDSNGYVDLDEYVSGLQSFDQNEDGLISLAEFVGGVKSLDISANPKELDLNNDGQISFMEFSQAISQNVEPKGEGEGHGEEAFVPESAESEESSGDSVESEEKEVDKASSEEAGSGESSEEMGMFDIGGKSIFDEEKAKRWGRGKRATRIRDSKRHIRSLRKRGPKKSKDPEAESDVQSAGSSEDEAYPGPEAGPVGGIDLNAVIPVSEVANIGDLPYGLTDGDVNFASHDLDGNGEISRDELVNVFKHLDQDGDGQLAASFEYMPYVAGIGAVVQVFVNADKNGDEVLEPKEVLALVVHEPALRARAEKEERKQLRKDRVRRRFDPEEVDFEQVTADFQDKYGVSHNDLLFAAFDIDGDSKVNKKEFVTLFYAADENHDGSISHGELDGGLKHIQMAAYGFLHADANGDSKVDVPEFIRVVQKFAWSEQQDQGSDSDSTPQGLGPNSAP